MTAAAVAALVTVALTIIGAIVMMLMVNYLPESPIQAYIIVRATVTRAATAAAVIEITSIQ